MITVEEHRRLTERLSRALRTLRDERRLKQGDVAERAGITRPMLSAYERGRQLPALDTLWKVLKGLDVSFLELAEVMEAPPLLRAKARQAEPRTDEASRAVSPTVAAELRLNVLDALMDRWISQLRRLRELEEGPPETPPEASKIPPVGEQER